MSIVTSAAEYCAYVNTVNNKLCGTKALDRDAVGLARQIDEKTTLLSPEMSLFRK